MKTKAEIKNNSKKSRLGCKSNPYTKASRKWKIKGVPYGSYCKCYKCGFIARSTIFFDFYAKEPGDKLECESCKFGISKQVAELIDKEIFNNNKGEK